MNKQATKKLSPHVPTPTKPEKPTTTENNKTNLGKRKKSEPSEANSDASDDLDSVILSEARKKIRKLTHSNTIDGKSTDEKMKSEMVEVSFVQTKMGCACGSVITQLPCQTMELLIHLDVMTKEH